MAAPTGSVVFDKATYLPGETITATVRFSDPDSKTGSASFDLVDSQGNKTPASAVFTVTDPVSVAPSPSNDRTWTLVAGSNDGSSARFTAKA